ncbi:MAG TPA: GGDEF domain-containing protein [Actinoplanes sp.]|nr:GGDEF domain-containing protein [Actinoplanes sp.]
MRLLLTGAGLVAGHFLILRALPPDSQAATNFSVTVLILSALAAAASALVAARRGTGRSRIAWAVLAVGVTGWALGESTWAYYVSVRETTAPFPNVGDFGFLLMIPCTVAALIAFLGVRRGLLRVMLDGLLIAGSLLVVSWLLVLESVYRAGNLTALAKAVSAAYPLGDVLIAAIALILLPYAEPSRRRSAALVVGGAVAFSTADLGFAYLNQHASYTCGHPVDSGWVAGFVMFALAAHHAPADRPGTVTAPLPILLWLPYLPMAVAVLAAAERVATGGRLDTFTTAVLGTVILLVLARQLVALRDNSALSRELHQAVAELRRSEERLRHLAYHDPLTGAANRALFLDRAESRATGSLTVLYLDLDGFKPVNDRLGHAAGDTLLVEVVHRLRAETRDTDLVARLGGDEFAILLSPDATAADADHLSTRLATRLSTPFTIDGQPVTIGASIGTASRDATTHDPASVLRRADEAMYRAKARTRPLANQSGHTPPVPTGVSG